ncbi:hypothetical protein [Grimontia hollisae]|uniref:hypothetical protein n=1 Tax=Grimontia hollisae TaxID=673 RepID=UPI0012ACCA3B|nr:hypothetical protein [Grimontia hollisae]
MITTLQLLDELKRVRELDSDRAAAKYLKKTQAAVSKWRTGHPMSLETAVEIAEDLELDLDLVVLSNMSERRMYKLQKDRLAS